MDYVKLRFDLREYFDFWGLTDSDRGQLIMACFDYVETGEAGRNWPEGSMVALAWIAIRRALDEVAERCETNKANRKKRTTKRSDATTKANDNVTKANDNVTKANDCVTKRNDTGTNVNDTATTDNDDTTKANDCVTNANDSQRPLEVVKTTSNDAKTSPVAPAAPTEEPPAVLHVQSSLFNNNILYNNNISLEDNGHTDERGVLRKGVQGETENGDAPDEAQESAPVAPKPSALERRFAAFWAAYPKKRAKGDAMRAFERARITDEVLEQILHAIARQKATWDWQKQGGQFIPYPATWINRRCWEDEIDAPPIPPTAPAPTAPVSNPYLDILASMEGGEADDFAGNGQGAF